ncbi:MAG: Tol-Pal system protein TolB [Gammaproteobacteria bacterium]|nr:MAG: Tol-Pal system protein TolB [Gammaproteobacteria bacterium]
MHLRRTTPWLLLTVLLFTRDAAAILTIEITQGAEGALPIAIVPFSWTGATALPPENVSEVVTNDLARSGRFKPLPEKDMLARPHQGSEIRYRDWRILGTESLVVGRVQDRGNGNLEVQFQLFDVFRGEQLIGYSIPTTAQGLRRTAHQVSDLIYEALTGKRGAFTTRVAYIVASRPGGRESYQLQIADADGHGARTVLNSNRPIMSPAWSPDGNRLAYVSFEEGRPELYVQDTLSGQRRRLLPTGASSSAPAWSPDGSRLALTSSRDGNPEIYIYDMATSQLRRLTRNPAIDTEPAWSPDGRSLIFTSDRGGGPQIYRVAVGGGDPRRLTFEGRYNVRGSFSPDGKWLALVHGENNRYSIGVLEIETGILQLLTDGALDESPSFAPNGSMIIYATAGHDRGVLAAVSIDGRVPQPLLLQEGDVRDPAWSPYRK